MKKYFKIILLMSAFALSFQAYGKNKQCGKRMKKGDLDGNGKVQFSQSHMSKGDAALLMGYMFGLNASSLEGKRANGHTCSGTQIYNYLKRIKGKLDVIKPKGLNAYTDGFAILGHCDKSGATKRSQTFKDLIKPLSDKEKKTFRRKARKICP